MLHRPAVRIAVALDHLARDGRHRARAQVAEQDVVRLVQLDADRVAVDRREAFDRRVVVELAARARRVDDLVGADHLALQVPRERRADARIEQPLPRVDVIGGRQLAAPAVEGRIVGEIDAGPDANGPRAAAVVDLRQCRRGAGHALVRTGEVIEAVQRLEDRPLHVVGIQVARRLRIEARLGDGERDVQRTRRSACAGRAPPQRERGAPTARATTRESRPRACHCAARCSVRCRVRLPVGRRGSARRPPRPCDRCRRTRTGTGTSGCTCSRAATAGPARSRSGTPSAPTARRR